MRSITAILAMAAMATLATACGGGGGGGGGGSPGPAGPTGTVGAACNPDFFNEACQLGTPSARLKCDPTAKTWSKIADCPAGTGCGWLADPGDPGGAKRLTQCVGGGAADATGGSDASTPTDAGADAGGTSDTLADGGGGAQTCGNGVCDEGESASACPLDCKGDQGELTKCWAKECGTSWGSCIALPKCLAIKNCEVACSATDTACLDGCAKGLDSKTIKALTAINQCLAAVECGKVIEPPTKCGDGKCEGTEDETTCPQDCKKGPVCGDGKCEEGENATNCAKDCNKIAKCGDLDCVPPENPTQCAPDCDPYTKAQASCFKNKCGAAYDACINEGGCMAAMLCAFTTCTLGDAKCVEACGNVAGGGSAKYTGIRQCASITGCVIGKKPQCGNGKCETGEDKTSCAKDCGDCALACFNKECGKVSGCPKACGGCGLGKVCQNNVCASGQAQCGDGSCDDTENDKTCPKDCDAGSGKSPVCGDGKCETGEDATKCPLDCKTNTCGNGKCDSGENATTCPKDCTPVSGSCKGSTCKYVSGAKCQCDTQCVQYNDCCPDVKTYCP